MPIGVCVFGAPDFDGHEQVVFAADRQTGLKAIIAIHDTSRGPALGGCRLWPYVSEDEAVRDVLRLSRAMTYKAALAGLSLGGGKSVILADPDIPREAFKTPDLMRAMGRAVERLHGRYIVAEDVGTSVEDMGWVRRETAWVAGLPVAVGGSGDPSPATAYGVFRGIVAAVHHRLRRNTLEGLTVAVQGLGHVGWDLCRRLVAAGASLFVSDIRPEVVARAVGEFHATPVAADAIVDAPAEVFAPCALGAVINDHTIGRLKAVIVAGSANNQLAEPRHGQTLAERGILYVPDYAINVGGLINVAAERDPAGYDRDRTFAAIERIPDTLAAIFQEAEHAGIPTSVAADRLAEARLRPAV
ncbi:MAG TPA: Glu/Leu/Phe/Val dehydrogenase dimerization domain-containing protein [Azospirillaceae bacterium]|nr:Glu/Leu/Phe/Val dehydrogenase dimerization domain-containing protein [Azospirillaceae bacterium]